MVVLYNDTKKLLSFLKTDYSQRSLKPLESLKIDEKLILRKSESLKMYSEDEYKKINVDKKVVEKVEAIIEEPKVVEQVKEAIIEEPKVEVKKPRRGRKPKQTKTDGEK